ncbi:adenylate/guanylate cyclase domain-containing protein [Muricoccus roseus]|uniref:adenylate/guanylate cyclase domain-containing protein n=1 Tax=Muricoccus roseus TaxID=198092 RepID=UPI001587FE7C|nr:adenylate/guanylate cyclase domain-containing protein [Roseomonas rosea]
MTAEAGERRPVTVLFADLVGSSALAARLDPEDLRRLLLAYREAAAAVVARHGGSLAQHQGDGLLARFGFPLAREDDAERALRAGLDLVSAVGRLRERLEPALRVRVAVHSGIVVVATLGHGAAAEPGAMVGEATTIAARLQHAAGPGEVWVSEATRRLAPRRFRYAPQGEVTLAGLPRPVLAHRLEAELPPGLVPPVLPMVGREDELRSLFAAWRDAQEGAGTAVMIEAEPGHGKSRLIEEFRLRLGEAGPGAVLVACSAGEEASAFRPLLAWLARAAGTDPATPPAAAREALRAWMAGRGLEGGEHAAPLAVLMDCATPEEAAEMEAAGRRRRRRNLAALLAALRAGAAGPTPLFIAEDIHWADESTLAVLRSLADACAAPETPMLLLLTRRTEGANLPGPAPLTLRLARLGEEQARHLAAAAAPEGADPGLLDRIISRAGGVPIFLVEAARDAQSDATLPLSLRAGLTARLDAMPEAKPVAQLAAVIGRSFRGDLITALAETVGLPSPRRPLRRLVEAGLMEPEGPAEAPTGYAFRHELMRDMAYETLLRSRRASLHLALARLLPERFGEMVSARPEMLARHLAAGGAAREAIVAYEKAAGRAMRAGAHAEAAGHFRAAIAELPKLDDATQRDTMEAPLQIGLASQLTITRGNAVPEVGQAFATAHAAALRLDDRSLLLRTLRGLQTFHLVRGAVLEGHAIGERIMALMAGERDAAVLLQAHRPFGLGLLYLGRHAEAQVHLERVLALYDPARDEPQRFDYGSDPAVLARAHLGWARWFQGDADGAFAADAEGVAAARAMGHAHSLCFALAFRCALAQFAGHPAACLSAARELQAVAAAPEFPYWSAWGAMLEGWARARMGDAAEGETLLRQGLRDYAAMGAGLLRPYGLALLAGILPPGREAEAAGLLEEAEELSAAGGIRFAAPIIDAARERLRGGRDRFAEGA